MHDIVAPIVAFGVLPLIAGVHALYFLAGSRRSTQHRFRVVDESAETRPIFAILGSDARTQAENLPVVSFVGIGRVEGDLHVADGRHYRSPLKITGDLVVEGHAVFDSPVIVNGHARVSGEATFHAGLLVKGDLLVTGRAGFGRSVGGSWCVARKVTGRIIPAASTIRMVEGPVVKERMSA